MFPLHPFLSNPGKRRSVMEADVLVGRGVQLMQSGTGAHYYSNYDKRLRLIFKATVQTIISE